LIITIARGASFRNLINWVGEQPSKPAAALGSSPAANQTSRASANSAGKSSCRGLTSIRPPRHRFRQSSLVVYGASALFPIDRRTVNASSRRSRWRAVRRFSPWERRSDAWAVIPVGLCVKITAVSTLLRFCPPGPERRVARNSHCVASTAGSRAAGWSLVAIESGSGPARSMRVGHRAESVLSGSMNTTQEAYQKNTPFQRVAGRDCKCSTRTSSLGMGG
jgi:hypothetical protein